MRELEEEVRGIVRVNKWCDKGETGVKKGRDMENRMRKRMK